MRPLNILFVHQNFPGQYRALAPTCLKMGHRVLALSSRPEKRIMGIENISYTYQDLPNSNHVWVGATEQAVARGAACAKALELIIMQGFVPDLILGHAGWGEMMFFRQIAPKAKIIAFCEYYYHHEQCDVDFDLEFASASDALIRTQTRNLHLISSLVNSDAGVAPTHFQGDLFPDFLKQRLRIIHDGIETERLLPRSDTSITLGRDQIHVTANDQIITFINRNLEPMRGYHSFMRAVPEILERLPKARIVLVGGHDVSYGPKLQDASYKDLYLHEVFDRVDMSRLHFVGQIPYPNLVELLCLSTAHVYLTYPFVLSWSMLEAMSLGCVVIGSKTPPVQEIITHGQNGFLVDFFDTRQIAHQVCEVVEQRNQMTPIRHAARQSIVEHYDFQTICLPQHLELIQSLVS